MSSVLFFRLTHFSSSFCLNRVFAVQPAELMVSDSVMKRSLRGSSAKVGTADGNPLWATDNTHGYFAELIGVNVHLVLLGDNAAERIEYDMVYRDEYKESVTLTFRNHHYSVIT